MACAPRLYQEGEVEDALAPGRLGRLLKHLGQVGRQVGGGKWPVAFSFFLFFSFLFIYLFCFLYNKTFYKKLQLVYKNLGDIYIATPKFWRFLEFKLFES